MTETSNSINLSGESWVSAGEPDTIGKDPYAPTYPTADVTDAQVVAEKAKVAEAKEADLGDAAWDEQPGYHTGKGPVGGGMGGM